jgi:hypothetical protein
MFAPAAADHENIHGRGESLIIQSIISARQRAKFRWRTQAKRKLSSVLIWFFDQEKSMCWRKERDSQIGDRSRSIIFPVGWPAASPIESLAADPLACGMQNRVRLEIIDRPLMGKKFEVAEHDVHLRTRSCFCPLVIVNRRITLKFPGVYIRAKPWNKSSSVFIGAQANKVRAAP